MGAEKTVENLQVEANRFIVAYNQAVQKVAKNFNPDDDRREWRSCPFAKLTVVQIYTPQG